MDGDGILLKKIIENKPLTLPEVKKTIEGLNRELNQFQRKTLDYTSTFSKTTATEAERLTSKLVKMLNIDKREAIQIVNCMPETIEELRVFLTRHRVIETEKLEEAVKLLNKSKK